MRSHLDALKTAVDMKRVAAALGLRGQGGRFFCPSCQAGGGKTPDLSVRDGGFVCFKCGLKGDALALIQVAAGLDFMAAIRWLESEAGIAPPLKAKKTACKDISAPEIVQPGPSCEAVSASVVYEAFLADCRPVEGRALDWMKAKGATEAVVQDLGVRFCGREYADIMRALGHRFGEAALLAAGLLKASKAGRAVPSFWHYFANQAGFLVIPYWKDRRAVYLKARPPVSKTEAEKKGLVRFMNTSGAIPCLYNVDVLRGRPDRVLVCEGESDVWTALSYGFPAVGSPGAKAFKEAWVEDFRGIEGPNGRSAVYLVLDADQAGQEGARIVAGLFKRSGQPIPLRIELPPGQDLTDFMKDGRTE